jgi:tRNA/tmRNA/rRNA uracil-C5-methylase (TrmA/RlmC/RlmD family)
VESVELRIGVRSGERLVVLHGVERLPREIDPTRIDAAIALEMGGRLQPVRGFPRIHERVLDRSFRISAASFFQVNTDGAECLAALVQAAVSEQSPRAALDLYAGVGLFSATALRSVPRIVGVEVDPSCADDFRENTRDLSGARLRAEPVVDVVRDAAATAGGIDVAVVNPPRAGMGADVVEALLALRIPRLIVVSCDPGSLGRDLGALARAGYVLRNVTPVDQFPGTPHVEAVAVLDR